MRNARSARIAALVAASRAAGISRACPDRESDAARRHRRRVLSAGPRAGLRGSERHPHPLRSRPDRGGRGGSAPRQDRHHPREPHARRPCGQRAQQGAELRHLRQARRVGVGDAQLQRGEHRARQEVEDRDRQRDAAFLRGEAEGQRRRSRELDPRALRRQRHRRRRAHRDGRRRCTATASIPTTSAASSARP